MSIFNNSIFYAQFQSRGGLKTTGIICGAYALLFSGIIYLTVRMNPRDVRIVMSSMTAALIVVESLVLSLFGTTRVSGAIRHDIAGKIIESHRLMPISSAEAVLGYLFGAPCLAIGLALTTVLIGCVTATLGGIMLTDWLTLNLFLAAGVLAVWTVTAFGAFLMRGAPILVAIPLVVVMMSNGAILLALPGLFLLMAPMISVGGLLAPAPMRRFVPMEMEGIGAIAVLGAIFFCGAARRYRRSDAPALGTLLGLLLLAAWVGMSMLGIANWEQMFMPSLGFYYGARGSGQVLGTLLACLPLAVIPVGSAAVESFKWRSTRPEDRADKRRPIPPMLIALVAAAMVWPLALVVRDNPDLHVSMLASMLAMALAMLTLVMVVKVVVAHSSRTLVLPMLWLISAWVVPLLGDMFIQAFTDRAGNMTLGDLGMASPVGTFVACWGSFDVRPRPMVGLISQTGILAIWAILAARYGRAAEVSLSPQPVLQVDHPSPGRS